MADFNEMSWQDKLDRLELLAEPELMPLVVSIRADMEFFAAEAGALLKIVTEARQEIEAILSSNAPA